MFRHSKHRVTFASLEKISVDVEKVVTSPTGVQSVSIVSVPCEQVSCTLPLLDEYTLENLLASGVPLSPVSCALLDIEPTQEYINSISDKLNVE